MGYFFIDLILFFIFLYFFNSDKKKYEIGIELNEFYKKATIIVPAYNEEVSIVQCIDMLYKLDYPDFEIIVVNDGSSDNTLMTLLRMFSFEISGNQTVKNINTADVHTVYNCDNGKIILIDKVNGGKADSIND